MAIAIAIAIAMNWLLRSGRSFLQLLFEPFVFRGQRLDPLLECFDPHRRAVPRGAIGIQLTTKMLVLAAEELDFFLPTLVLLTLPAIHGQSNLPLPPKSRAGENQAAR